MVRKFQFVVYKITFPNGKIYIGKDISIAGHSIRYFGSWSCAAVEADFTTDELRDFSIRREILFESDDQREVSTREMDLIRAYQANDPEIGYNKSPKFKAVAQPFFWDQELGKE